MLLSLGSNGSGQLGLGHVEDVDTPQEVPGPFDTPVSIRAGGNHTLVIFQSGNILASGDGSGGRCNFADNLLGSSQVFTRTCDRKTSQSVTKWKFCSATWEASTFITTDNEVFASGSGNRGELGLGEGVSNAAHPIQIVGFPPPGLEIVDVSACMTHTVAVLSNGEVFGWGSGRKGQLGEPPVDCWRPRKLDQISFKAARVACGRDFTFVVSAPDLGHHCVLGSDKWKVRSDAPDSVLGWINIGASWGSIFVLHESGKMISWGRNDHRQLAPQNLPPLISFAAGSEHVVGLTKLGKVLAWGWGEHGNCGRLTHQHDESAEPWSKLDVPSEAVAVGAGCATSWIACKDHG